MCIRDRLKGQGPECEAQPGRPVDGWIADVRAGRPQSGMILDAHAHVLHEGGQGAGVDYLMYDGDARGMLEVNVWCSINRIAMMSWHGPVCTDEVDGNDILWRAMQNYGD